MLIQGNHQARTGVIAAMIAVLLWGTAPALVEIAHELPPLQLASLCLLAAAATTAPTQRRAHGSAQAPAVVWLLAPPLITGAIAFYFAALQLAPPAHAALVTYTWPALFVVAAELAWRGRLGLGTCAGMTLAFAGAGLVLTGRAESGVGAGVWAGYACAIASGLCWAAFSFLGSRTARSLSPHMPRLFGLAVLWAAVGHGFLETTAWPVAPAVIGWVTLIGAGPYGLAFLAWDRALRLGPPATVGSLAYGVPIISGVLLVATGAAAAEWRLPVATLAVIGGCVIASRYSAQPRVG